MIGRKSRQKTETISSEPKSFDDFETRLGDLMRGERATIGKSLLDVQRDLRIKAAYIAAIENCDPTAFETPGFIAGYVRSYARYLGMDPDLVFQAFCEESGFATAHGMSSEASARKRDELAAATSAAAVKSDPLVDPRTAFVPPSESVLSRVEPGAVGSVLVLALLLGGIGYGGWSVLQEVQRVQLAPVEQTPIAVSDLDPLTAATAIREGGEEVASLAAPTQALDRLYRPQALDVPVLVARDAPISTLDPRSIGSFASPVADVAPQVATAPAAVPPVSQHKGVTILAARPSWMQVEGADGSVAFEGVMNGGDTQVMPVEAGRLIVGRPQDVYLMVDGVVYGPAGPATGRGLGDIDVAADAIVERYETADLTGDADLATLVAELEIEAPAATQVAGLPGLPADLAAPAIDGLPTPPIAAASQAPLPQVFENGQPVVTILASGSTWVRVRDAQGATLFSGEMAAGETFRVPQTENPPVIRTGNAGAVYFSVGGVIYGPYGDRGQIADRQQLNANALTSSFAVADMSQASDEVQKVVAELAIPQGASDE